MGVLASLSYATTGWRRLANWLGSNAANPGLKYVDTHAHGYGLVQLDDTALHAQLVTVESPDLDYGCEGPKIVHSARFRLNNWSKSQQPYLDGPTFTGPPPFPYGNADTGDS